ncbi:MAG: conjugal transfer transcriptional regulator TraJ [Polynucleobacter sp.]|nr:conjugal transfer transcriptional regulator TraJ [Polynucleobacter sp.]
MEKDKDKQPTRKHRQLRVPVLPVEEETIKKMAASAGLPVAAYLRNVGLGYQVRGILDNKRVEELARINGDLGRLGGLLKLWLTDDPRTHQFGESTIRALLSKIEDTQDKMHEVMRAVVMPRTDR